jgi:hypothetical protein
MTMKSTCLLACFAATMAVHANAAEILVSGDITTSVTWTRDNVYNLQGQVTVLAGATITIEAGTVIASDAGGSLAVARGAMIDCRGTETEPIIFTSKTDYNTWTPANPQGVYRRSCNEWGNLTIMGRGYIGKYNGNAPAGNTASPNAANYANMEGLVATSGSDTRTRYGGGDDTDDSGSLRYTSFRYGGLVVGLTNELNGLSLGGVGSGTEIDHIEIMNNVDDGIEIWGGKVDLKYFSIWNIGDDSFDLDQGWRGRAQFGLIVQGASRNAASGSGVCDSIIEADGAEFSDAQPVLTCSFSNFTLIGQPLSGKRGLKYRDNARFQLHNSIIMDVGEAVVRLDNTDGEAANGGLTGYGHNGTLTWAQTWTTAYNVYSTVNPFTGAYTPAQAYSAQVSGRLNQITDTVFYNNNHPSAYTEANNRGVFDASNNNVLASSLPIAGITRGASETLTGTVIQPVNALDPRAANDAVTAVSAPPNNGFFTQVNYRGAFGPNENWMCGWTAADAYGLSVAPPNGCAVCPGDLDGNGFVDSGDIGTMLILFGNCGAGDCPGDLDGSRTVDAGDIGTLLILFGACN